jgi:hypothetical protein
MYQKDKTEPNIHHYGRLIGILVSNQMDQPNGVRTMVSPQEEKEIIDYATAILPCLNESVTCRQPYLYSMYLHSR